MCFVGSVYRAQGLWQEQLTLPFNNLGKSLWEECSGKLFPCCSQRENRIHPVSIGQDSDSTGHNAVLWLAVKMKKNEGEG